MLLKKNSMLRLTLVRLRRNHLAMIGLAIVLTLIFVAVFADYIAPFKYSRQHLRETLQAPNAKYLLGTDEFGRDVLSRLIYGARVSLVIQFWAVMISLVIGTFLGSVSGYFGGRIDEVVMRLMDIMMAFPGILLALAIVAILGPSLTNLIVAIGINSVPGFSRVARGAVISVKKNDYVTAARAIGESDLSILFRYVLPNAISPIIVQTTMRMATVLLTAAGLGFLGLGVQPPSPEWGTMLSAARVYLRSAPHVAVIPGVTIMIVVLGFNFFGDGLQDALNPRLKE